MWLLYCTTEKMVADIMTKPLSKLKLEKFADLTFGIEKTKRKMEEIHISIVVYGVIFFQIPAI